MQASRVPSMSVAAPDPITALRAAIADACEELHPGISAPGLERPPRADLGDYSTNAAMLAAPLIGAPPREAAASLAEEGFVHCTDGVEALRVTFDRHYAADPRPFLALTLDLDALEVPWRHDVPDAPYPHVYGTIRRDAVLAIARVERDPGGRFVGLSPV